MAFVLDDIIDRFWKDGRVKELEELASHQGYRFTMRDRLDDQTYKIKSFQLFGGRKAKRLRGILTKRVGSVLVRMYDYVYYGESKKRKTTVFELYDNQLDLSPFIIRPKRGIQWLKEVFHKDTTFFPHCSAFHAYYEIDTQNKRTLGMQVTEAFVELISSTSRISVEGDGSYLLVYFRGVVVPANHLAEKLDLALDLLESLFLNEETLDDTL